MKFGPESPIHNKHVLDQTVIYRIGLLAHIGVTRPQ